jgi:integrase
MGLFMGLMKDRHGTYYARKRVPKALEAAVATVLANGSKKSLGTKRPHEARIRVKPVLMAFDRVLADAAALLKQQPLRTTLTQAEIDRIVEYHFATTLAGDEDERREGTGNEELVASIAQQLTEAGIEFEMPLPLAPRPAYGLSEREVAKRNADLAWLLPIMQNALARGDISKVSEHLQELLAVFQINLDPKSEAYRRLGMAVLTADVEALRAIARRNQGEPITTPIESTSEATGDTLRAAFLGWQKARKPSPGTLTEYSRAISLFVELHGDMPVVNIKRSHARELREALQDVPRKRTGKLGKATLPELAQWGREHPEAPRLSNSTINKLMSGVQAISLWARDQGLVPEDVPWSDPFAKTQLKQSQSGRGPFTIAELKLLFASPVFMKSERPEGGRGDAAFWLPLLGLFTGARRGELAGLTTADATNDDTTGHPVIMLTEDQRRSKSLKTPGSARTIPLHPELIRLGFMQFVDIVSRTRGDTAWLFPEIAPDLRGGASAWTKWFSRYIRLHGVQSTNKVFHSLRHNFKDALRAAKVSEDLNDALTGHSTRGSVSRSYGSRDIVLRYGMPTLIDAVSRITFVGLDLSSVGPSQRSGMMHASKPTATAVDHNNKTPKTQGHRKRGTKTR